MFSLQIAALLSALAIWFGIHVLLGGVGAGLMFFELIFLNPLFAFWCSCWLFSEEIQPAVKGITIPMSAVIAMVLVGGSLAKMVATDGIPPMSAGDAVFVGVFTLFAGAATFCLQMDCDLIRAVFVYAVWLVIYGAMWCMAPLLALVLKTIGWGPLKP